MRILVVVLILLTLAGCAKDKVDVAPINCEQEISFSNDIQPMMATYCIECHNDVDLSGGYSYETYEGVRSNAELMLKSIQQEDQSVLFMPESADKLPDSIIHMFNCWIFQGKLNN